MYNDYIKVHCRNFVANREKMFYRTRDYTPYLPYIKLYPFHQIFIYLFWSTLIQSCIKVMSLSPCTPSSLLSITSRVLNSSSSFVLSETVLHSQSILVISCETKSKSIKSTYTLHDIVISHYVVYLCRQLLWQTNKQHKPKWRNLDTIIIKKDNSVFSQLK